MANIAYHYTSLNAFFSIVKDKHLLLTSLRNMNDPTEGGYSVDAFMQDYNEIEVQYKGQYPFLTVLKEQADQHKKDFEDVCNMPSEPYSTCFSRKRDSISH